MLRLHCHLQASYSCGRGYSLDVAHGLLTSGFCRAQAWNVESVGQATSLVAAQHVDPPGPGIELVSQPSQSGLATSGPPGKPVIMHLECVSGVQKYREVSFFPSV